MNYFNNLVDRMALRLSETPKLLESQNDVREQSMVVRALDIYAGSGAVTAGLKAAGFCVVAAVDFDPIACATYRKNHCDVDLWQRDITTITDAEIRVMVEGGEVDLIAVCAPCQPFSSQNRQRSGGDARRTLLLEALRFIRVVRPRAILAENVPGFIGSEVFNIFSSEIRKLGFEHQVVQQLDAADFGVPQRRQRAILLAHRDLQERPGEVPIPAGMRPRTVRDAIADLTPPSNESAIDRLHVKRRHLPIAIERLRHIPKDGGSRHALPDHLVLNCHKSVPANSFSDVYGRMAWDAPAPTLTTGCTDLTRGRYAHPEADRAITAREAARLQSFPDEYEFDGNRRQIAAQIGNAVPPKMVEIIGRHLMGTLAPTAKAGEPG